jgi:hypothetical protein
MLSTGAMGTTENCSLRLNPLLSHVSLHTPTTMLAPRTTRVRDLLLVVTMLLVLVGTTEAFFSSKSSARDVEELPPTVARDPTPWEILMDPISFVGHIVYEKIGGINRVLRWTTGKQISEYTLILLLRISCNTLYLVTIIAGFMVLPKNVMIFIGIMTSVIGPLIALVIIGVFFGTVALFIYAPVTCMNAICLSVWLGGPMGQRILKSMGLDKDKDGDVDMIDILRIMAHALPWFLGGGKSGRLNAACDFLNRRPPVRSCASVVSPCTVFAFMLCTERPCATHHGKRTHHVQRMHSGSVLEPGCLLIATRNITGEQ